MDRTEAPHPPVHTPHTNHASKVRAPLSKQEEALLQLKLEKLKMLEEEQALRMNLPHRHAHPLYRWQRDFLESRNRMKFLTAANQIGKSSVQIIDNIELATNPDLWPTMWATKPNQFWYLYPNRELAHIEYETKWKLYLPRNEMQAHSRWGWTPEFAERRKIAAIHFNSGVHMYFKTYSQDVQDLQAGTVYRISADEEMPWDLYPEIAARLNATDGYFSMVFTATLGQQELYETMEMQGQAEERFKDAFKQQVSLYDCRQYEDGTPSLWTEEKINRAIARCGDAAEIQRRIFGRFVFSVGKKYSGFSAKENARPYSKREEKDTPPQSQWLHYGGIDYGSGGTSGHPAAIVVVAVHPKLQRGRLVRAWRGDHTSTTAYDIVRRYESIINTLRDEDGNRVPVIQTAYDWASPDLYNIALVRRIYLTKANKNHDVGESTVNSLFRNKMVEINNEDPEQMKLAMELSNLRADTPKNKAKDDLIDAFRYSVMLVPWDWSAVGVSGVEPDPEKPAPEPKSDREWDEGERKVDSIMDELEEFNELLSS